jgi:hypothetical protein
MARRSLVSPAEKAKWLTRLPGAALALARDRLSRRRLRYRLVIGAIFRDEARFLDEWVAFHHARGVEHFYLYDNGSSDDVRSALAPWLARGVVTLISWPRRPGQKGAYRDCVRRCRSTARWLAFIDIDEFLFSPVETDLRTVLQRFDRQPAVFVYGHMYGASGHDRRPPGPVTQAYVRRAARTEPRTGKSILNPRLIRNVPNPHYMKLWVGETRDEQGRPVPFYRPPPEGFAPSFELLRINHYWSRSLEDLADKVRRGNALEGGTRDLADHLRGERWMNEVEDRILADAAVPGR